MARESPEPRKPGKGISRDRKDPGPVRAATGRGSRGPCTNSTLALAQANREHRLDPASTVVDLVVEVERRVDERQVAERLREVAKLLAGQPNLLGVETEVVGVGAHLLQRQPRILEPPRASQRVYVPERADGKGPLRATQTVGRGARIIAVDKAVGDQLLVHGSERREPHGVARG